MFGDDPNLGIRRAYGSDAAVIAEIHVLSRRAAYRELVPPEVLDSFSVMELEAEWSRRLSRSESPEERVWLVETGGNVTGFLSLRPCADDDAASGTIEIVQVYFLTEWCGRGVGRMLLDHALADLVERGVTTVTGWVLAENQRASAFLLAAGFVLDGVERIVRRGGVPLTELRHRLDLPASKTV